MYSPSTKSIHTSTSPAHTDVQTNILVYTCVTSIITHTQYMWYHGPRADGRDRFHAVSGVSGSRGRLGSWFGLGLGLGLGLGFNDWGLLPWSQQSYHPTQLLLLLTLNLSAAQGQREDLLTTHLPYPRSPPYMDT